MDKFGSNIFFGVEFLFGVFVIFKIFFDVLKFRLNETGVVDLPEEQNGGFLTLTGVTCFAKLCLVVLPEKKFF